MLLLLLGVEIKCYSIIDFLKFKCSIYTQLIVTFCLFVNALYDSVNGMSPYSPQQIPVYI